MELTEIDGYQRRGWASGVNDTSEFEGWLEELIHHYIYNGGGGYPGEIYVLDDVIVCSRNKDDYETGGVEIYNRKKLEESYAKWQNLIDDDEWDQEYYDILDEAALSFDDITITIKETKND